MKSSNRLIVAILVLVVLAVGFWMLALAPKRKEADELSKKVDSLSVTLASAQSEVAAAEAARRDFPADYRQLVVLGQAVPEGDETSSLLVELDQIAAGSKIDFESFQLSSEGGEAAAAPVTTAPPSAEPPAAGSSSAVPAAATVPPTEAAASLLPLGASVGAAGLGVMPYNLSFSGTFFQVADFIKKIDSLIHTGEAKVGVSGRLMTIDGFALTPEANEENPDSSSLTATFAVRTYVTPPSQGTTAGASPTAPAAEIPASEAPAEESGESSETVAAR
jgi:Tfp pilus assembly protein PilO